MQYLLVVLSSVLQCVNIGVDEDLKVNLPFTTEVINDRSLRFRQVKVSELQNQNKLKYKKCTATSTSIYINLPTGKNLRK